MSILLLDFESAPGVGADKSYYSDWVEAKVVFFSLNLSASHSRSCLKKEILLLKWNPLFFFSITVSDYWTSGHFSNATSEWLWKNGKNTTVAGHEQAEYGRKTLNL